MLEVSSDRGSKTYQIWDLYIETNSLIEFRALMSRNSAGFYPLRC